MAEFRNLQDRTQRDVKAARDFAIQRFAKDLIDSVDNLDRALTTVPETALQPASGEAHKDLVNLHQGLKMTETILMQTLGKHGLERFDPSVDAEPFNPNLHEATFQTPLEGKDDGTVMHTQQKGFTLNGRVLRVSLPVWFLVPADHSSRRQRLASSKTPRLLFDCAVLYSTGTLSRWRSSTLYIPLHYLELVELPHDSPCGQSRSNQVYVEW